MDQLSSVDRTDELATQLTWHWELQVRSRLEGLTDEEYFWEPVPECWSVRPRGEGVATAVGGGDFIIDFAFPQPDPPRVTTIAWRLGHLLVGVLGARNATYFDGPAMSYDDYAYPGTAAEAMAQLDTAYACWITGMQGLDEAALSERCREPGFDELSVGALVLHIHREMIHHLAEICLLRDLFRARAAGGELGASMRAHQPHTLGQDAAV